MRQRKTEDTVALFRSFPPPLFLYGVFFRPRAGSSGPGSTVSVSVTVSSPSVSVTV